MPAKCTFPLDNDDFAMPHTDETFTENFQTKLRQDDLTEETAQEAFPWLFPYECLSFAHVSGTFLADTQTPERPLFLVQSGKRIITPSNR